MRGRWYGMMVVLGNESGRNMSELLSKGKASEVLTMLEISNEFPKEFKVVNELMSIEKELGATEEKLSAEKVEADYILGAIDAKKIKSENRSWRDLTILGEI